MTAEGTALFAAVGASLGVVSFCWNVWTWVQGRRPRLSIEVRLRNVDVDPEIVYTIRNRGAQATTIEELQLINYRFGPVAGLGIPHSVEFMAASNPDSVQLPAVILPGGIWIGTSPATDNGRCFSTLNAEKGRLELVQKGRLYYKVRCSHFGRMILGKVRGERLFLLA